MEVLHLNQKQLANRWSVSEATLERWRSVGIGPVFLKLFSQVRYRLEDIEAFEESCLATSTKTILHEMALKDLCGRCFLEVMQLHLQYQVVFITDCP